MPKISLEYVEEEGTESNSSTDDDEMERSSNILELDRWFTFLAGTTTRFLHAKSERQQTCDEGVSIV